ncbi:MAG: DUF3817 domain-containing protein [Frankiaceae bacterium]|nr:DUF3817 domain-containing protein [Frankiaceae bacterium]MBV9873079.1 DUF3817 domain-containing protein [Frankiaceae bacterium]
MPSSPLDAKRVEAALLRYRIAAFVVGISILVLVCVGIPLDKAGGHPGIDQTLGFVHGAFFYPIYILLTLDLARRTRMHPVQLALAVVFGTVPIVSFYAEHRTTQFVRERLAAPADGSTI